MSRNGSGTYNLLTNSWNPATNGVSATAVDWQNLINDVASALTQSLSADGQTPMTGNLNAGNNKLTGLAAGSATGDSLRWEQLFSQGQPANLASAATTDIGAQNTVLLNITGTTTITSFGTNYNGPRYLRFDGVLTLTHNATTLILPGGANITTAAGDSAIVVPNGTPANGWRVVGYQRNSGSLFASGAGQTTAALTDAGLRGATLRLSDTGNSVGAGGAILFANAQSDAANSVGYAAIKGLLSDGGNNTSGGIAFSTRNATSDIALTTRMTMNPDGSFGIGVVPSAGRLHVSQGTGTAIFGTTGGAGGYGGSFENTDGGTTKFVRAAGAGSNGVFSAGVGANSFMFLSTSGDRTSVIPGGTTLLPEFQCRAWVNFNGTGTVAIRASGNVSSITDNGTGDYTVNFTTAMTDTNYAQLGSTQRNTSANATAVHITCNTHSSATARSTGSVRVVTSVAGTGTEAGTPIDCEAVYVAIFR
jgi:hypothetical protein